MAPWSMILNMQSGAAIIKRQRIWLRKTVKGHCILDVVKDLKQFSADKPPPPEGDSLLINHLLGSASPPLPQSPSAFVVQASSARAAVSEPSTPTLKISYDSGQRHGCSKLGCTKHGIITSMHQHFGSHWALVVTQPEEGNAVVGSAASPRK